jgi:hypothetical protein
MRVRSHRVQQATGYPGTVAVTRLMVVTVLTVVGVLMVVAVLMVVGVLVTVLIVVTVRVAVLVVRAARAVHVIQHARENALPHINTYQGRALANWPQPGPASAGARLTPAIAVILRFAPVHGFKEGRRP